jgi:AraC-like DNA-binding protein
MKALSFKVPKTRNESLRVQVDHQPYFYDHFHYHPEVQISYIIEGTGTRIIGDSVGRFNKNELYIIGSNIPHIFKSDRIYYEKNSPISHAISFYFTENAFGNKFFNLPETKEINELLLNAKKIVFFDDKSLANIEDDFIRITNTEGFEKLQMFFKILNKISKINNQQLLSKTTYELKNTEKHGKRINDIFDFVINNYEKSISLNNAAEIANLSTTAFCRFFKERTRKSFTEFVNEVRIGEACKMLSKDDFNISQICYEVGFNNISNFNRKFKEITNLTPKHYRETFSGDN